MYTDINVLLCNILFELKGKRKLSSLKEDMIEHCLYVSSEGKKLKFIEIKFGNSREIKSVKFNSDLEDTATKIH